MRPVENVILNQNQRYIITLNRAMGAFPMLSSIERSDRMFQSKDLFVFIAGELDGN